MYIQLNLLNWYSLPRPDTSGDGVGWPTGYCFRSISLFVCFFVSKITRKRLGRFAWNFQGRCGVTMGWRDSLFGQFGETARCCDVQHAPQLVLVFLDMERVPKRYECNRYCSSCQTFRTFPSLRLCQYATDRNETSRRHLWPYYQSI